MKLLTCKRGHDTSFPEARDKAGRCRECERQRLAAYDASPEGRRAHAAYNASPAGKVRNARWRFSPKGHASEADRNSRYRVDRRLKEHGLI